MNRSLTLIVPVLFASWISSCAATANPAATESYLQTGDGTLLHFRKLGDGPEVVVVPGESFLSPDLDRVAAGRTLIYYDMRNRGRSGKAATARLERDLEDLDAVLDWFKLDRATLMGFDYGAALCSRYAAAHPERVERLVLVSPLPLARKPYYDIYRRLYDERVNADAFARLRELQRGNARRLDPEAWRQAYRETVLSAWVVDMGSLRRMRADPLVAPNGDPEAVHRQYRGLISSLGDWDWTQEVAGITAPTLVLHGQEDSVPSESAAAWAATLTQASVRQVEGSARMPWIERPGPFFEAVEGFLAGGR